MLDELHDVGESELFPANAASQGITSHQLRVGCKEKTEEFIMAVLLRPILSILEKLCSFL